MLEGKSWGGGGGGGGGDDALVINKYHNCRKGVRYLVPMATNENYSRSGYG